MKIPPKTPLCAARGVRRPHPDLGFWGVFMPLHLEPATMRIACVGDSLTRGDGAHEGHAQHPTRGNYPATLQHLLPGATVRNFGHGGATACNASDTPYEATREFRHARAFHAHVVVLMLGTNDAKQRHWRGVCKPGIGMASGFDRILSALQPAASVICAALECAH